MGFSLSYHIPISETISFMESIQNTLLQFRNCFSREVPHEWFIISVLAMMVRQENHGMTDFIRLFDLEPNQYENLVHFFKSDAWILQKISDKWTELVFKSPNISRITGMAILIMDGVKKSKEGRKMVGEKKLHQESENSGKGEFIHGHMFGGLGALLGNFCVPLSLRLHDGVDTIMEWIEDEERRGSHVQLMIRQTFEALLASGESAAIALGDRYFLSVTALKEILLLESTYNKKLHFVTKAKRSGVAYTEPPKRVKGKRGRPRIKGERVKLRDIFQSKFKEGSTEIQTSLMNLYGEKKMVKYYFQDLLWGQKHYQKLRFVWVEHEGRQEILVSTDLSMAPQTIIKLYACRFKVEPMFRNLKQEIGAFDYHFWTDAMPKLDYFKKKGTPDPLKGIEDEKIKGRIIKSLESTEMFTMCGCIALGLLQMKSLELVGEVDVRKMRYQRTYRTEHATLPTIRKYLGEQLFLGMAGPGLKSITEIINARRST
jgi:hypothetical protein